MNVLVHIFNKYDEIRGGYVSPVIQAAHYQRYKPVMVYTHDTVAASIARKRGMRVEVIGATGLEEFFSALRRRRVSHKGLWGYLAHTAKLFRMIRKRKACVVHVQNFESFILCFLAAKLAGVPIVNHIRGDGEFNKVERLLRLSDCIVPVSESLAKSILTSVGPGLAGKFAKKIHVIGNGVEIPEYAIAGRAPGSKVVVGFVGYISGIKGQLEFLRNVWSNVRDKVTHPVSLVMIGPFTDGEYYEKVRAYILEQGMAEVEIAGMCHDMADRYPQIDLLISFSVFEGMPRTVMEAMSYGIPCVVTDIVGNRDVVEDGVSGYVVQRHDTVAFAARMTALIEDSVLRSRLGSNARRRMIENYGIEKSSMKIEQLYDLILTGRERI